MKILLLGEYSNLHWTLAQGLRILGCNVTVASTGDNFKNYNRDISLIRKGYNIIDSIKYVYQVGKFFSNFKGFDIVQVINPFFLDLQADRNLQAFNYLKKHNGKVFMGAFGDDTYWLQACLSKTVFRYSEFDIPNRTEYLESAKKIIEIWSDKNKVRINTEVAERSDGIIACLYEYYASYKSHFGDKLTYIPAPVNTDELVFKQRGLSQEKLSFFIGVQNRRSEFKGTDVLYRILREIKYTYPAECEIVKAESVPYSEYMKMTDKSDVLLDQLYSYSLGMNGLMAMSQGLVVVGGGEPEAYDLLGESSNRPVINVIPTDEDVFKNLESLIKDKGVVRDLSYDSRSFIEKHHSYMKVAKEYIDTWSR